MAFIESTVISAAMTQQMHLDLYLPNDGFNRELRDPDGIIYMLHGLGSNERNLREYTSINRYAMDNNLAVVYINAPQSFFNDMVNGLNYFTYITEELPKILKSLYGLRFPREKTFVAGPSMGGYGALLLALSRPDMFGRAASLSGACDIRRKAERDKAREVKGWRERPMYWIFGEDMKIKDEQDLFFLAEKVSHLPKDEQPRLFLCCGNQDEMHSVPSKKLFNYLKELGTFDAEYAQWDGGHDYAFWDRGLLHAVAFFKKNDYDELTIGKWTCMKE